MKYQLILLIGSLSVIIIVITQIVNPNRAPLAQDAIDFGLKRFGCLSLVAGAVVIILAGLWLVWFFFRY